MPAEPVTVDRPLHPLGEMTSGELSRYRSYLERTLGQLSDDAEGARADVQAWLDGVLAEQDDRQRIRASIG